MGIGRDSFTCGSVRRNVGRAASLLTTLALVCMVLAPASPLALAKPQGEQVYVVGAVGDPTGTHLPMNNPNRHQYDNVADMLYDWDLDKFLMLGDGQHENGLLEDYLTYYDSEFGKLLDITAPIPGNHDYYWDWE